MNSNERITQALIRGVVVMIVAGLTALGADAANIVNIGTGGDEVTSSLVLSILLAIIQFALKYIGGPTTPAPTPVSGLTGVRGVKAATEAAPAKRPNILSV